MKDYAQITDRVKESLEAEEEDFNAMQYVKSLTLMTGDFISITENLKGIHKDMAGINSELKIIHENLRGVFGRIKNIYDNFKKL